MKRAVSSLILAILVLAAAYASAGNTTQKPRSGYTKPPKTAATKPIEPICGFPPGSKLGKKQRSRKEAQPKVKASYMMGSIGDRVPLKAKLTLDGKAVPYHKLRFEVDNVLVGEARTNNKGEARIMYKVPNKMGAKRISVRFLGSTLCARASDGADFGTIKSSTRITLERPTGFSNSTPPKLHVGDNLVLEGTLERITDQLGLNGRSVGVKINGVPIAPVTAAKGHFRIQYRLPQSTARKLSVEARFEGDALYLGKAAKYQTEVLPPRKTVRVHLKRASSVRIGDKLALEAKVCVRQGILECGKPLAGVKVVLRPSAMGSFSEFPASLRPNR